MEVRPRQLRCGSLSVAAQRLESCLNSVRPVPVQLGLHQAVQVQQHVHQVETHWAPGHLQATADLCVESMNLAKKMKIVAA